MQADLKLGFPGCEGLYVFPQGLRVEEWTRVGDTALHTWSTLSEP